MHGIKGAVIVLLLIISSGANAEQEGLKDDLTRSPDDAFSVDAMVAQLKAAIQPYLPQIMKKLDIDG